jgi:hypothetical protein
MMSRAELTMNAVVKCYAFLSVLATIYCDIVTENNHVPVEERSFC